MNEYQKQFDKWLNIFVKMCIAWWVLGFLKYLPNDIADRVVNKLLGMFGI